MNSMCSISYCLNAMILAIVLDYGAMVALCQPTRRQRRNETLYTEAPLKTCTSLVVLLLRIVSYFRISCGMITYNKELIDWLTDHFLSNTAIFLNRLIQFYSNNATNLRHSTSHSTPCCPTTQRSRVTWPHTTVTRLRPTGDGRLPMPVPHLGTLWQSQGH